MSTDRQADTAIRGKAHFSKSDGARDRFKDMPEPAILRVGGRVGRRLASGTGSNFVDVGAGVAVHPWACRRIKRRL